MAKRKRNKKVKVAAHKLIIKQAKKEAAHAVNSERVNEAKRFLKDIEPYFTKKGELRKNLSNKRKNELNRIIAEYKNYKKEDDLFIKLMNDPAVRSLMQNNSFGSSQVELVSQSFPGYSNKLILQAFEATKDILLSKVPDDAKKLLPYDDAFRNIETFLNLSESERKKLLKNLYGND